MSGWLDSYNTLVAALVPLSKVLVSLQQT